MEFDRQKIIRQLECFHHRILNSNLAEKITEKEITAIINAAALLIEDEKKIKEFTEKNKCVIIEKEMLDECTRCKHFVGCECFDGVACKNFERA